MIISHVKIIAFQTITNHSFWTFYIGGKPVVYIINRKIHGYLEIPDLFLVLNITLEINLVFPRTHVLFSIYEAGTFFVLSCPSGVPVSTTRIPAKLRGSTFFLIDLLVLVPAMSKGTRVQSLLLVNCE